MKTKPESKTKFFGTWKSALLLAVIAGYNLVRGIANENYYNIIIGIILVLGWLFFTFKRKKI